MKRPYLALLLAPLFSTAALATGYVGPGAAAIENVAAAHKAADDTPVVLQGHIMQRLKGEKYEFRDDTGSINVEIDDEDWPAVAINEKTRVKLSGEVDRGLMEREVDVDFVEVLN